MCGDVLCRTAANTRRSWEKRVAELEKMESTKAQQKAAAEVAKKQAESKLERLKAALSKVESLKESMKSDENVPTENDGGETVQEEESKLLIEEDEDIPQQQQQEEEDETEEEIMEEEETEEERAKRIASQWIPGQGAEREDGNEEEDVYEPEDATPVAEESTPLPDPVEEQSDTDLGIVFALKMWFKDQMNWITGKVDIDKKLSLAKSKVDAAQKIFDRVNSDFSAKESDLRKLQDEKSSLEKKLETEYGPSNVFLSLAESCVETNIDKYQYKICPFGDAFQVENGRNTRLGSWSGFEENGSVMSFTNGEGCWQGPSRSINVSIVCGSKDVFESVSEPSRCTYTGVIRTPAYCTKELIESMEKEVSRRKQLLNPETPKEEL